MVTLSMGCWQRHDLGAGKSVYVSIRKFMGDMRSGQNIQDHLCVKVAECNWFPAMTLLHGAGLVSSPSSPSGNFPNRRLLHKQILIGTHHILHLMLLLHGAYNSRDND